MHSCTRASARVDICCMHDNFQRHMEDQNITGNYCGVKGITPVIVLLVQWSINLPGAEDAK